MEHKNTVPILEKALDVLEYIGASEGAVTLPELQRNLGIAQASCYRIASTLVQRGWLEKCSGARYEIAPGISRAAGKIRFRLEKYKPLQPAMNRLADETGFPAKFSVREGDEFVNVCSARSRSGQFSFSDPGFRQSLRSIASVSTIFLAESPLSDRRRLVPPGERGHFRELSEQYLRSGYCFIHGQTGKNAEYPFDTLSFPVRRGETLTGVVSFLSLPGGGLREECARLAEVTAAVVPALLDLL